MRIVALAIVLASVSPAYADPPSCDDPAITHRVAALVHARRFADAHHAVVGLRVTCGDPIAAGSWRVLDDIALLRLEDRVTALHDLHDLADHDARPEPATVVLGWAYATDQDHQAAAAILARLPAPRAAAISALAALDDRDAFDGWVPKLSPEQAASARALFERYDDAAHTKHPALAGVLSAIVPGAGQIYSGSLQAAALTFVLNALFISTTVEQALDHHYATAAAAVTVAAFINVGGIINAVDLSRRRNRLAAQPARDALELLLVPELDGAVE